MYEVTVIEKKITLALFTKGNLVIFFEFSITAKSKKLIEIGLMLKRVGYV